MMGDRVLQQPLRLLLWAHCVDHLSFHFGQLAGCAVYRFPRNWQLLADDFPGLALSSRHCRHEEGTSQSQHDGRRPISPHAADANIHARCRKVTGVFPSHDIECSRMQTAEVVIIGGGIVGSSIAYHLTAAGCKDVLVIERETAQGKGSTGKSMGGVRAQFSTAVNIQMSLYSIPFYASFDERLGYPADYRPQGYLFCATSEKHLAYLRTNYEKQVAMGLKDVRLISADEIRDMFPQLRGDDIVGGSFCASDGFVDPYSVMIGFMAWAADHGARLWKNTQVTGIDRAQAAFSVQTSRGPV